MWTTGGEAQVLVPVKELGAWIETNILLDLASAPFDRHDAALLPDVPSCDECPKRTGANTLLFPGESSDSCLDRECYSAKIDRHIARALEQRPDLIQISSWWGSRNGGPLGRNRYVEVTPAKNGNSGKATPIHKRCAHLAKGIIVEGGSRGQILTICAEPSCTVHHAQTQQSREAKDKARVERQKQSDKRKLELTTRHRVLAAILAKISAPLSKLDLALIATASLNRLSHEYVECLAVRHKLLAGEKTSGATNYSQMVADHLKSFDETGLSRLLIEISLVEAATNTYSGTAVEPLEAAAKRYRVNTEKIGESVVAEFAAKQRKRDKRSASAKPDAQKSTVKKAAKRKP